MKTLVYAIVFAALIVATVNNKETPREKTPLIITDAQKKVISDSTLK